MEADTEAPKDSLLDPSDWGAFAATAHRMLDDALSYIRKIRERPPWKAVPQGIKDSFLIERTPLKGESIDRVYEDFKERILPYPTGNIHPRFWGWVMGTGTPVSMLAEMLAATMNSHVAGYDQSAVLVENQVIRWLVELLDYPVTASGLLVSGGTAANLHGLAMARNAAAPNLRRDGIRNVPPLYVYASQETHSWLRRSCELLGMGESAVRLVPVDAAQRILIDELTLMIGRDRREGGLPICIVGNAGTVNTGSTDDLERLAAVAKEERLWFHVDGAFGALAKWSPMHRGLVAGIERADTIALDLHKWPYVNYEVGCILFRDDAQATRTFSLAPSYLRAAGRGISADPLHFADRGVQLSRGFRALKVWMMMKTYGIEALGASIGKNIEQAHYAARYIDAHSRLELLAPVSMNVVCLRYVHPEVNACDLASLNHEILIQVQERGIAVPSSTTVGGTYALRLAITNHRTTLDDIRAFLDATVDIGNELVLHRAYPVTAERSAE
jgi:aromatic-L-amino-acid/L-tryptophan decarboxylase